MRIVAPIGRLTCAVTRSIMFNGSSRFCMNRSAVNRWRLGGTAVFAGASAVLPLPPFTELKGLFSDMVPIHGHEYRVLLADKRRSRLFDCVLGDKNEMKRARVNASLQAGRRRGRRRWSTERRLNSPVHVRKTQLVASGRRLTRSLAIA